MVQGKISEAEDVITKMIPSVLLLHKESFTLAKFVTGHDYAGNTKGGSITVPLTSCLTGLESAV